MTSVWKTGPVHWRPTIFGGEFGDSFVDLLLLVEVEGEIPIASRGLASSAGLERYLFCVMRALEVESEKALGSVDPSARATQATTADFERRDGRSKKRRRMVARFDIRIVAASAACASVNTGGVSLTIVGPHTTGCQEWAMGGRARVA